MSIFVTSHAWKNSAASGSTLLVLLAICDFADDEGQAFPSVATLATKSRSSERTAQYALRELIQLTELSIIRGAGRNGCNLYQVRVQNMRGGANSAGVQPGSFGGATHCTQTVSEPSKKKESAGAKAKVGFDDTNGEFTGISDQQLHLWSQAYPGVSVSTEIVRAACWVISNPVNRPKSAYGRFLNGWLSRTAKHPPLTSVPRPQSNHARREAFAAGLLGKANQPPTEQRNVIDIAATEIC